MSISLQKGQKVSLTKDNPGLTKVVVGIGWDINQYDTGTSFDLDSSAFLLTSAGKVSCAEDFVFYGNLKHPSGAVEHMGDNRTGAVDSYTVTDADGVGRSDLEADYILDVYVLDGAEQLPQTLVQYGPDGSVLSEEG